MYRFSINNTFKNSLEMNGWKVPLITRHLFPPQLLDNLFFIVEILAFLGVRSFSSRLPSVYLAREKSLKQKATASKQTVGKREDEKQGRV